MTTAMIATGGFGVFPDNPLTRAFQKMIGENISADFLEPFNSYMEAISAPTISLQPASASNNESLPDPLGFLEDLFAGNGSAQDPPVDEAAVIETVVASIWETQTQIVLSSPTMSSPTATPTMTQTSTPTLTSLPASTLSITPTWTSLPVFIFPTATGKPPLTNTPTHTPTFTAATAYTPTTTYTYTPTSTTSPTSTATATLTPITNWIVQSTADDGTAVPGNCPGTGCRLRDAIAAASAGNMVSFLSTLSGQTIALASTLTIDKNMTIDGSSLASMITVSGNNDVRVFYINSGVTAELKFLRVAQGYIASGEGAGLINYGNLTITNSIFDSNVSGFQGGGVTNGGTLTVTNSTFSNNTTTGACGAGINNGGSLTVQYSTFFANHANDCGGAISGGNPYTVVNSTFTNNTAGGARGGGALFNNNAGGITVINSTLSGNAATGGSGGGISLQSSSAVVNLRNTIISDSTAGGDCYNPGSFSANINNLIQDGSCSPTLTGAPLLDSLAYNGGPTQTMALLSGSPAIDAGDDGSCPSTDQRGVARPLGAHCDIGAYESPFTAATTPAGHTISSFSLNGGGTTVTVSGGSSVTVDYTYQVWGDSGTCPGCNYQLVWGLDNNWQYCSAWTSPSPGDHPGQTGTGSQFSITAPAITGTYTIYSFSAQYTDCTAAIANYMSSAGTAQGTINVP